MSSTHQDVPPRTDRDEQPGSQSIGTGQALRVDAPGEPEGFEVSADDRELLEAFIQESREHLDNIEEKILSLERTNEAGLVDEIFRSMHTMKGSSSFFGFTMIERLAHTTESLLDKVRSGTMSISGKLIDVLLAAADMLLRLLKEIEATAAAHPTGSFRVREGRYDITDLLERIAQVASADAAAPAGELREEAPVEQESVGDTSDAVTGEITESFLKEAKDLLNLIERSLLDLEKNPRDQSLLDGVFRAVHTIKGNAGFLGYALQEITCMEIEDKLDEVRRGGKPVDRHFVSALLRSVDSLRGQIGLGAAKDREGTSPESQDEEETAKPIGRILIEMGAVSEEDLDHALELQDKRIGEILAAEGKIGQEEIAEALKRQQPSVKSTDGSTSPSARSGAERADTERRDIRVDVVKLDRLFELMGELITAEAMVVRNPDLEGLDLPGFTRAANYLGKITRQMQEITMSVRMIPLEGSFNKIRRAARDLSRRFGRELDLLVEGQDTEMDRTVIEELSDPLLHIIRNAIDHGIEDKETRRKAGKPARGTVRLGARYEGSEIWITVCDDGKGLDREKILAKAVKQGLVTAEDAPSLTDGQVWMLLFSPGFSTAETVSEISGRGVGLDVVKKNIERLRGRVDISTVPGKMTEIVLKIPLTLAIIDGVTVQVGNLLYVVPLGDIREFYQGTPQDVTRTGGMTAVLRLRDELLPIVRLHEFFHTERSRSMKRDGIYLIIRTNTKKAALLVDEIVGYQQVVVKSLPEYMGDLTGLSGCSILGNGEVALIIDTGSLVKNLQTFEKESE